VRGETHDKGSDAAISSSTARKSQYRLRIAIGRIAVASGDGELGSLTTSSSSFRHRAAPFYRRLEMAQPLWNLTRPLQQHRGPILISGSPFRVVHQQVGDSTLMAI